MRTLTILSLLVPFAAAAAQNGTEIWMADIVARNGQVSFANVRRVTDRPGYDNQPRFTVDGRSILYSSNRGGQTDIWRYDIGTGAHQAVTNTPESEYSPTEVPEGRGRLAVVRVERDSTQRIWTLAPDGTDFRVLAPDLRGVGYYQWFPNNQLIAYMVGDPADLEIVDLTSGSRHVITQSIGPTFHVVPDDPSILYVARHETETQLIAWSPVRPNQPLALGALPGAAHFAFDAAHDRLFAPRGDEIVVLDIQHPDQGYQPVRGLEGQGLRDITRITVSLDGRRVAIVAVDPQ